MTLSKKDILAMRPGQMLTVHCENAAELDSSTQTAYRVRRMLCLPPDTMRIIRRAKKMSLSIKYLVKP